MFIYNITVINPINQLMPEIQLNGCHVNNHNDQFFPCALCNQKQTCLREDVVKGYSQLNYAIWKGLIK